MGLRKHIPNTVTCLNLISGAVAVIMAFQDRLDAALGFIILAAAFDFLDGLTARALNAYSEIGKELDSLSDTVSFGLAPSLILYNYLDGFTTGVHPYVCYFPLILAAFTAVRLAKFNIDTRQSENFLGLPVPASGLCAASLAAFAGHYEHIANTFLANNLTMRNSDVLDEAQIHEMEGQRRSFHISVHNNTRRSRSPCPEDSLDGHRILHLRVLHHLERGSGIIPKTV